MKVFIFFLLLLFPLFSALPILDNFLQCLQSKSILESIYTPNNSSFHNVLEAYIRNRRFLTSETPKPLAIITAKYESHVQETVICARLNDLQIRIRSGGHDYEGLSYKSDVPFLILDMFNLRAIDINIANETAWVQAGATLGELYYNIAKESKVHAFPAGVCPTVGIGGHFTGGGYGNLMRKYGLSVDNIIDAKLVDVNGNVLDRKSMGEDLFWAIRGGGGASFGVILSWKINLVRVPDIVTVFRVEKNLEQEGIDILNKWQQVASKLDKEVFIRAKLQGQKKTIKVSFFGLFLGKSNTLLSLMNKKFQELGLKGKDCNEVIWIESTMLWAEFPIGTSIDALLNRTSQAQVFFKSRSDYVKRIIPKKDLKKIWKMLVNVDKMYVQWNPYGGRMSEILDNETPFPHRNGYLFKIQYYTSWNEEGIEASQYYINLSRKIYNAMAPYVSKNPREAFLNYRDLDIGSNPSNDTKFREAQVYGTRYFKGNFVRLVDVKKRVDPYNFFKNEQSIPP